MPLWQWALSNVLTLKKGQIFDLSVEIVQHFDIVIGKEAFLGREDALYHRIEAMIRGPDGDELGSGLALLATTISLDDFFAERFLDSAGIVLISNMLVHRQAIFESILVLNSLNHSRTIYRQAVLDGEILGRLTEMMETVWVGRSIRQEIHACLAEYFIEASDRQVVQMIEQGHLDAFVLYASPTRNCDLYHKLIRALSRVLDVAEQLRAQRIPQSHLVEQKLYELNTVQVLHKLQTAQPDFATEHFVSLIN